MIPCCLWAEENERDCWAAESSNSPCGPGALHPLDMCVILPNGVEVHAAGVVIAIEADMQADTPEPGKSPSIGAPTSAEQPGLFAPDEALPVGKPPASQASALVELPALTPTSTLGACALPYQEYLRRTDHSAYTITCFLSDLRLLTDYLGRATQARAITRERLIAWLDYLRFDRGAKPAPKTLARRVT